MKIVTVSMTRNGQPQSTTVQLNSTDESAKLTPSLAASAARIAYGHATGVAVSDKAAGYVFGATGKPCKFSIESYE